MTYDNRTKETTDIWLTPPPLLRALGAFDLDPSAPLARPWDTAAHHYTVMDDGLVQPWFGRVWLNPPYGRRICAWMERMRLHGNGVALTPCRTETEWFFTSVWGGALAVLFMEGRIRFHRPDGSPGASPAFPTCLIAYGEPNVSCLKTCGVPGYLVEIRPQNRTGGSAKNAAGRYDSFQGVLPLPDGRPTAAARNAADTMVGVQ